MDEPGEASLKVRSHVTPWGFLVALGLAIIFALGGAYALDAALIFDQSETVPRTPWETGAAFLAFAMFLFLVGVSELASFLKPSPGIFLDPSGLATFGLLGQRHVPWNELASSEASHGVLTLHTRGKGRVPPPVVRLDLNRLDVEPGVLLAYIGTHRPDLVAGITVTA